MVAAEGAHGREILPGLRFGEGAPRGGDCGRVFRDELAGGALRVNQADTLQIGEGALDGVGIDAGIRRKVAHRGELAAGRIAAGDNLLLKARDKLRVDGLIGLKLPGPDVASCANVLSD